MTETLFQLRDALRLQADWLDFHAQELDGWARASVAAGAGLVRAHQTSALNCRERARLLRELVEATTWNDKAKREAAAS